MGDWRELDRDQLEKHLDHECKKRGMTRRDLMKGGAGMAAALGLGWLAAAAAATTRLLLRVSLLPLLRAASRRPDRLHRPTRRSSRARCGSPGSAST